MDTEFLQQNLSVSAERGTLRGMHFQHMPYAEAKLIRCPRGALVDTIIDLRPESPSFEKWEAFELNEENKRQFYVPKASHMASRLDRRCRGQLSGGRQICPDARKRRPTR